MSHHNKLKLKLVRLFGPNLHDPDWRGTILLIHGIDGRKVQTWRSRATREPWYRQLAVRWGGASVYSIAVGYRKCRNDLEKEKLLEQYSSELVGLLKQRHFLAKPAVFIGHSLGGILLKAFLNDCISADPDGYYDARRISTRGVVFLGVPHLGSPWALPGLRRIMSKAHNDLIPNGRFLSFVHDRFSAWTELRAHVPVISVHEKHRPHIAEFDWPNWLRFFDRAIPDWPIVPSRCSTVGCLREIEIPAPTSHFALARFEYPGAEEVLDKIINAIAPPLGYGADEDELSQLLGTNH